MKMYRLPYNASGIADPVKSASYLIYGIKRHL